MVGLSEVIGSWNTIATSAPLSCRSCGAGQRARSLPAEPDRSREVMRPPGGSSRMIDIAGHGLAAPGLADQADHLALPDRERDPVDRVHLSGAGGSRSAGRRSPARLSHCGVRPAHLAACSRTRARRAARRR